MSEFWKPFNDREREMQLLWITPEGDDVVIGLCPYRGQILLTRPQARDLAAALLEWADNPIMTVVR